MSSLVYIIDDEPDILELIALNLKKAGFRTKGFENAGNFLKALNTGKPDVIVLDLMLPDMDGLEVCKLLKKKEDTAAIPVLMLTAKGEESDKVLGLELGADDYMTKPFSPKELVARVKVLLRRSAPSIDTKKIQLGPLLIDVDKHEVLVKEEKVTLTATEFKILLYLARNKGLVFSREKLLDHLWGFEKSVIDRTVDVHIKHLREKLGKAGGMIKNLRGVGYKLEI